MSGSVPSVATAVPGCPACSTVEPRWEIASPVAVEDRIRFDAVGLNELGFAAPEEGVLPLGRPVVRCRVCGATATQAVADAVLQAVVAATTRRVPRLDA